MKIRIATRGSDLALAQAYYVQKRLLALGPDAPETEIKVIKTSGDRIQDVPLSSINSGNTTDDRKGFFTKEIEDALLAGDADIAVHSFKDLPTLDVSGLRIVSMPQRLTPNDIILFPREKRLSDQPPYIAEDSVIGTSSVRRISQIQYRWPRMKTRDLRGNVPTRIRKLLEGNYDAILLSGAGFDRLLTEGVFEKLDLAEKINTELEVIRIPPEKFVPAPAQGALALQCRDNDPQTEEILLKLQDNEVATEVAVERAVLKAVEGGCHLPLGSYCKKNENDIYNLHIFLGKEAVDNKKKISYHHLRRHTDPGILTTWAIAELKREIPTIVTGRQERVYELTKKYTGRNLYGLPLLRTTALPIDEELRRDVLAGLAMSGENQGVRTVCVFSAPGAAEMVRFLLNNEVEYEKIQWGVVGNRTEDALLELLPDARVVYRSQDGTGGGLAREILNSTQEQANPVLIGVPRENRPEFELEMQNAGRQIIRMELYETTTLALTEEQINPLPAEAYILLGSPSAASTFVSEMKRLHGDRFREATAGFRYCTIGPTTSAALEKLGELVYAQAVTPDYDQMIEEFS